MKILAQQRMKAASEYQVNYNEPPSFGKKPPGNGNMQLKVSEMVDSDVIGNLKDVATFIKKANINATFNNVASDILANREYTLKGLKAAIKILQEGLKHAITELKDISDEAGDAL